ncbi:MAG: hypothetical protein AB7E61_06440 [Acholeplasmataceae bacterium]
MTISEFITSIKEEIASKVGLSTSADDLSYVERFIKSGVEDLQENGVDDDVIMNKSLAVIALTQYVIDNLQETPGEFKTSPVYISNVQKLRYMVVDAT